MKNSFWYISNLCVALVSASALLTGCTAGFSAGLNSVSQATSGSSVSQSYTATPSGSHVTLNPTSAQTVPSGDASSFTVVAESGYTLSTTVGGTCPQGHWSGNRYDTGAMSSDCSVAFSATVNSLTNNNGMYPQLNYQCTTNYYVDSVTGNDSDNGNSAATAWKTLNKVASAGVFNAGVCVNFAPNGQSNPYTVSSSGVELDASSSGGSSADPNKVAVMRCNTSSPGAPTAQPYLYHMTLGSQGSMPKCLIVGPGSSDSTSFILRMGQMHYFVIDGFEITTTNTTGQENGIQIFGTNRDIWVMNNYIHDLGGQGTGAVYGDFYYFTGNVILRTALRNTYQESGISFSALTNASPNGSLDEIYGSIKGEKIHVVVANNVSALNKYSIDSGDSDGHGIIFDTVDGSQTNCGANGSAYSYGLLAYGNVVYGNGAAGLHAFFSNNVAFINNTAYYDYQDPKNQATMRAVIFNQCGSNGIWANNIGYNITGTGVFAPALTLSDASEGGLTAPYGTTGGGNTWTGNMAFLLGTAPTCYGGIHNAAGVCYFTSTETILSTASGGTNYFEVNPMFYAPSLTPLSADFRLQPGSPALGLSAPTLTNLGGPLVSTPNIGAW